MTEQRAQPPGARFFKSDLHIHTPASKCWRGPRELAKLFERIQEEGIELLAVTDHNTTASLEKAKALASKQEIIFFPGVEVTTKEGHVLAIFDPRKPVSEIDSWLTRIGIPPTRRGDVDVMATGQDGEALSVVQVFRLIEQEGGVAVAPHPNTKGCGFLAVLRQKGAARQEAYASPHLRALEVGDTGNDVLRLASGGVAGYDKKYACIASSDAHDLPEIGRAFTYIKLGDAGIGALRQAFYDPSMRIRFADQWPPKAHSWVSEVTVSQGFFDGVRLQLHPDMNAVVGGKSVGKSLMIELIRYALGLTSPIPEVHDEMMSKINSEVCLGLNGTVSVYVVSDDGERYRIQRTLSDLDEGPEVFFGDTQTKAADNVADVFDCKIYSQNEITELGRRLPALLDWLDSFLDLSAEREEIAKLTRKIHATLDGLDAVHLVASQVPSLERREADLKGRKELLEGKLKEPILKAYPQWQREEREISTIRAGFAKLLSELVEPLRQADLDGYFPSVAQDSPNAEELRKERNKLNAIAKAITTSAEKLEKTIDDAKREYDAFRGTWQRRFKTAKDQYEAVVVAAGVKNAAAITSELDKVGRALEQVVVELKRAKEAVTREQALRSELRNLMMPAFNAAFEAIFKKRSAKAKQITQALGGFVRMEVCPMASRLDFENAMGALARGSGLPKTTLRQMTDKMTPLAMAECLADKDAATIAGQAGVTNEQAEKLVNHAWARATEENGAVVLSRLYETACIELRDEVRVELRLQDGTYKPMHELSVGSKCTAILSVVLIEGSAPLIVDQPEDSLDNAFVFEQIVKTVRHNKAGRQFVFATHNPNLAVSTDADLILCLKATARAGSLGGQGSIDQLSTRDLVVANLEGGEDAFHLRTQKYDIKPKDPNAVVLGLGQA